MADASVAWLETSKGSATYNCGAEEFGSMREVLEDLCEYTLELVQRWLVFQWD